MEEKSDREWGVGGSWGVSNGGSRMVARDRWWRCLGKHLAGDGVKDRQ